jgi:uncharacterized protein (UPF0332 family)/predicted nucleotidyltransferase
MTSAATVHPAIAGDAPWQRAVCAFIEKVRAHYGDRLAAVVLYGSRARGDADEEGSDVDLLVVLRDDFDSHSEREALVALAYGLEESFDYPLLSPLVATEADYRETMLPLFMNIRREGIELWSSRRPKRVREQPEKYGEHPDERVRTILAKSRRALDGAVKQLELDLPDIAVNRAYYAMFHAVTALLLSEGLAFSRHRGVISAFNERYVKTKRLPAALGQALNGAFAARNTADYSYREEIGVEEARRLVQQATDFLVAIEQLLGLTDKPS